MCLYGLYITCTFHLLYTEKCLHVTTVFKYLHQMKRHVGMVVKPAGCGTMSHYILVTAGLLTLDHLQSACL